MADASTVTDTPGLLESALAFIRGETVPKTALLTAQARATQLESAAVQASARVKELDAALIAADKAICDSAVRIETLTAQVATLAAEVGTLKATAQTGARQAAVILSHAGIAPVTSGTETAATQTGEKTFAELCAEQEKAGKTRVQGIRIVMASNPAAYLKYLEKGGKL